MSTVRNTFGIASSASSPNFLAGIELEIEDIRNLKTDWNITEDGSLRNNGREIISPPLSSDALIQGFKSVHQNIKYNHTPPQAFSERTSIHVHVNCLDLETTEVRSIVLWYALFEPVFFAMCAPKRANNIHCVPLDQTILCQSYRRSLDVMVSKWSKYTALNLLPLREIGTIEFRHMEGHNDTEKFTYWMKTLENLWEFGRKNIMKKSTLEPDDILFAFDSIFKDAPIKSIKHSVLELVADQLIDIKLGLM